MSDFKDRQINKKKKFVADGIFNAEVHEFLSQALSSYGYGGVTIKASQVKTVILPKIVTSNDRRISDRELNEISMLLQKRFGFPEGKLKVVVDPIQNRGLSASAQVENLKASLLEGLSVRFCAMRTINTIMRNGKADGCEVVITGKLRQQRASVMKYKKGYIVSTGHPRTVFVDESIRHVWFKQGMIGIRIRIMLPFKDPNDKYQKRGGLDIPLPDKVTIKPPKPDNEADILPQNNDAGNGEDDQETPQQ
jgi:small subunit ribosomal protein S3e